MALAGLLLAPVLVQAQLLPTLMLPGQRPPTCTRAELQTAADGYVAWQSGGSVPVPGAAAAASASEKPSGWTPAWGVMTYVENFDLMQARNGLVNELLKVDRHLSLVDTAQCETYTEGLVSDKAHPYAFGARLRVRGQAVLEMEMMWSAPGDRGFDIDGYLKGSANEDWSTIPADRRDTRAKLESVANDYLDALLAGKAEIMPWGLPCPGAAANGGCEVGLPAGTVNVANRHYVVDETIGAVAVLSTIGSDPSTGRVRAADAHLFRVENGKVRFVHAVTHESDAAKSPQK
jgi:hypothetical protein